MKLVVRKSYLLPLLRIRIPELDLLLESVTWNKELITGSLIRCLLISQELHTKKGNVKVLRSHICTCTAALQKRLKKSSNESSIKRHNSHQKALRNVTYKFCSTLNIKMASCRGYFAVLFIRVLHSLQAGHKSEVGPSPLKKSNLEFEAAWLQNCGSQNKLASEQFWSLQRSSKLLFLTSLTCFYKVTQVEIESAKQTGGEHVGVSRIIRVFGQEGATLPR